jgi:hypothetical protein
VTNAEHHGERTTTAAGAAAVPQVGAPRPRGFWQRWKEWERAHGTVEAPVSNRVA